MDERLVGLQPGTVIAGRFEVVKCLGQGSMGLVYACRNLELSGHMVAMKVLFPEVAEDEIASKRFRNEIYASYGVSHPNVVRAYEYINEDDVVAYTMEFVGGGDLADRLEHEGKLPLDETVKILIQMCYGVQAIHDAGIIHRDLKPENILLSREGQVKIADFGIARTEYGPRLTDHGGVVGTLDYVSPEYMLNSQVDTRSDIYAMGILAYEMVTGNSPFRGESVYKTMTQRLKSDPPPPSKFRPECDPRLDRIILKAMSRNPEERYQTAGEVAKDLQQLLPDGQFSEAFSRLINEERPLRDIASSSEGTMQPQAMIAASGGGMQGVVSDGGGYSARLQQPMQFEEVSIGNLISDVETNGGTRRKISLEEIEISTLYSGLEDTQLEPIKMNINGTEKRSSSNGSRKPLLVDDVQLPEAVLEVVHDEPDLEDQEPSTEFINSLNERKGTTGLTSFENPPFEATQRKISLDTLLLMIGVTFGIVVGFFVVKYYFPDLL